MDAQVKAIADRSPNFGFLLRHEPLLVVYGAGAESAIFTDPNIALYKARQFAEVLTTYLVRYGRVRVEGDRQVDRLHALDREGFLHGNVGQAFHKVRELGNRAAHQNLAADNTPAAQRMAFEAVHTCFRLGVWFHRILDGTRQQIPFVPPQPPVDMETTSAGATAGVPELRAEFQRAREDLTQARLTYEHKVSRLDAERDAHAAVERELAQAQALQAEMAMLVEQMRGELNRLKHRFETAQPTATLAQREDLLANAESASREPLNEAQVRERLDRMLREAGWLVQDMGVELDLWAGQGVAAREVTTRAGRADYLLYVNRKLVGVIEAKREGADLSAAEQQADSYAEHLTSAQRRAAWRPSLPFRYASDGGVTMFRNTLDPDSRTREISYFHRPDTIARWVHDANQDPQAPTYRSRIRLRLPELITEGLRPAQIDAIRGVERSMSEGRERGLIQMATGAGKTFAACTFCYRLIKYAKATKVLFLVDRNNLGAQARTEFENFTTPDDGRKFTDLYNVQQLTGSDILASSSVVVGTIQRLYLALTGKAIPRNDDPQLDSYDVEGDIDLAYNPRFPPETFDLIVVDECHRSIYGKWRSVLEYFDASIIGLTATPVAQTFGFFHQNLVSEYTYEQAVADNVNVDFNVYRIKTEISEAGALIEAGTTIPVRDRRTRRQRYEDLDDDYQYAGKDVGTRVMSLGQLKTVIYTFRDRLYTEIFPERSTISADKRMVPKTLIFAKNDEHAEEIVKVVRDAFGRGNDFCAKITHKAKRPHELLAAFRNSSALRVAVTVDMIATGTDVRALECLVFLRDVRSWAYFEQMKGRGARTIPRTELQAVTPDLQEKVRFVIVDAIGVTENPKVDAVPLDRSDPVKRESLEKLLSKVAAGTVSDKEVSTLASRLARLDKELNNQPGQKASIEQVAGQPLRDVIRGMVEAVSVDAQEAARVRGGDEAMQALIERAVEPLAANAELRVRLLETRRALDIITDEINQDKVVFAGAVPDAEQGKSVVAGWREYLEENRDEITAWHTSYVQQSEPAGEVLAGLKRIADRIALPPRRWTHERLWQAYEQAGLTDARGDARHSITDLVPIIRYELGLEERLRPFARTIQERFTDWLTKQEAAGERYTHDQIWWLETIERTVAMTLRFDPADLDHVPFSSRGGTEGFLVAFGEDRAITILDQLDRDLTV